MRVHKSALAVAALFFLIAAGGYEIAPSGKRILPATLSEAILASRSISRNELILMQPVGRSYVATLDADLDSDSIRFAHNLCV
jgi:hypothetical protein